MSRKKKTEPRQVTVEVTCPKTGAITTDTVDTPLDRAAWAKAAERVDQALCGCGRPHHAVYSDDDPHTAPTPVVVHRLDGRNRPTIGLAS